MAQVFWKPKAADIGVAPSDLTYTIPWAAVTSVLVIDASPDPLLELKFATGDARRVVRLSAVGGLSIGADDDLDLYVKYNINGAGHDFFAHARVSGGSGAESSVFGRMRRGNGVISSGYYNDGAFSTLGSTTADDSLRVRKMRLRISGTAIKNRFWHDGGSEPDPWTFENTQTSVNAGGGIGLGRFDNSNSSFPTTEIYEIGVGTNGDPAPTGPVVAGAPVLSNPSASSITANSIVPNVTLTF